MAGAEDWVQRTIGEGGWAIQVYVHVPCGNLVDMQLTTAHAKSCPAVNQ